MKEAKMRQTIRKRIRQKNGKAFGNKALPQKGMNTCKILRIILKMEREGILSNGEKDENIDAHKQATRDYAEKEVKWLISSKPMQLTSTKNKETRYDWVRKVIHWKLCKRLSFDHTMKWYMNKSESVLEKQTHKITEVLRYRRIT